MIRQLLKRYKQGIHPCMLWFLIQYYYDLESEAMYDGDHILTELDLFPVEGKHVPLYKYGLQPLLDEFVDLNDDEKFFLQKYIDQNEQLCNN